MAERLRIVQLNLAYDGALVSPDALLARYHTLTGWSRAVTRAGAVVHVIQRFAADSRLEADGVIYDFVRDGPVGTPDAWTRHDRVLGVVRDARPDVVHINGLMFPGLVTALRHGLPAHTALVLQDHSGQVPCVAMWPLKARSTARWGRAFADADACTFTAAELAVPWFAVGLPRDQTVLEIPEASSEFAPLPRPDAARATGIDASPAILWVGRLDANKDPLTVLAALEIACARLPGAHCWMIYGDCALETTVKQRIGGSPVLRERVTLVGAVPHNELPRHYSASDIFLSGSHHEGSGYALIEAMACGLTPCVTDIPAFRALTGSSGRRWPAGNPEACATAILELANADRHTARFTVRRHFDEALSWDVIGRRTVSEYGELVRRRAAAQLR